MQFTSSLVALFSLVSQSRAQAVTACPGQEYPFQLTEAVLDPFPVVIGQNVSVAASGFLADGNEIKEGASYKIQLKLVTLL